MLFSELMESLERRGDRYRATISEDWLQGRTTYGGLTAALCLEAILRETPDLPPLRSAQVSFIGPAGGPVSVTSSLLRRGKSMSFVAADLFSEQGLAARAMFAFGAARESSFDVSFLAAPEVPRPDESRSFFPEGRGPGFTQHFYQRLAKGGHPASSSKEHDHFMWVRHRDSRAVSTAALLALADLAPPAMFPMFSAPAPISTVNWQVDLLKPAALAPDDWLLFEFKADNCIEGYSTQNMLYWNEAGEAVLAGRQSIAIFV